METEAVQLALNVVMTVATLITVALAAIATRAALQTVRLEREARREQARDQAFSRCLALMGALDDLQQMEERVAGGQPMYLFNHAHNRLISAFGATPIDGLDAVEKLVMNSDFRHDPLEITDAYLEVSEAMDRLLSDDDL